jgi:3alpha(or 20beta)-hydroxysteroid dehydrogenase
VSGAPRIGKKSFPQRKKTFGPLNVLVNNGGIVISKKLEELREEDRRVIAINQVPVFPGMKAVIPSMKKAKGGSIINISSINGLRGSVGTFAYDASKFAVRGMAKTAAPELAEYGIRVNSIPPGIINTPMVMQDDVKDTVAILVNNVPLKRIGQPEAVSNLVLFPASDEASYFTGSKSVIDGGLTAKY